MNIECQRFRKHAALVLAMLGPLFASAPARAGVIWIAWDSQGAFEQTVKVAPGEFAEVCGKLVKDESVGWSFASPSNLNFNVHYHVAKETVFFTTKDKVAKLQGELKVPVDKNYCWMWTNKNGAAASLSFRMKKQS